MSSLRSRLGKPIEVRTEEVKDGQDVFILSGLPSAKPLLGAFDATFAKKLAKAWSSKFAPVKFDVEDVSQILVVHHFVQHEEGEEPYDVTDIAEIFASQGLLFLKLLGKAYAIGGSASVMEAEEGN